MKHREEFISSEEIAVAAFCFLASDTNQFSYFINLTGVDVNTLRNSIANTEFLTAVLDYFLHDEPILIKFCTQLSINPQHIVVAHRQLANELSLETCL